MQEIGVHDARAMLDETYSACQTLMDNLPGLKNLLRDPREDALATFVTADSTDSKSEADPGTDSNSEADPDTNSKSEWTAETLQKLSNRPFVFGGVLRNITHYLFRTGETSQRNFDVTEFVDQYLVDSDVDIRIPVFDQRAKEFFLDLYNQGAIIEFVGYDYGSSRNRRRQKISFKEIDLCTQDLKLSDFTDGHYLAYIPDDTGVYIRYDIIVGSREETTVDFTVNCLEYPSKEMRAIPYTSRNMKLQAIQDIFQMRLQLVHTNPDTKIFLRAQKMFKKGYTFHTFGKSGFVQRLFQFVALYSSPKEKYGIHEITEPPVVSEENPRNIIRYSTRCTKTFRSNKIINLPEVESMMSGHQYPLGGWRLPDSGKGLGFTLHTVNVYKMALIKVYDASKPISYKDITSDVHSTKYRVLVKLEIPKGTRFTRSDSDGIIYKFRFERAVVKGFYSYPNREITEDITEDIQVFSEYDPDVKYVKGSIVKPTSNFDGREDRSCAHGIHAFLDPETAWMWTGARDTFPVLVSYQPTKTTVTIITCDKDAN
jgi:hypothetical protein